MNGHYLTAIAFTEDTAVGGCRCGMAFQTPRDSWAEVWVKHMEPGWMEQQQEREGSE